LQLQGNPEVAELPCVASQHFWYISI
jgi:hypothetical protein